MTEDNGNFPGPDAWDDESSFSASPRRRFLRASAGLGAAGLLGAAENASAQAVPGNEVTVGGRAADFQTIQQAVDAVNSSPQNPYLIRVNAGTFAPWSFKGKQGIFVKGSGRATIIQTSNGVSGANSIRLSGRDVSVEDMRIVYTETGNLSQIQAPLYYAGTLTHLLLRNLYVEVTAADGATAQRYGLYLPHIASSDWSLRCENLHLASNVSGVLLPTGGGDFYNTNIWLTGTGAHGLHQYGATYDPSGTIRDYTRHRFYSGRITCGYDYTNPNRSGANIYCFYVPSTVTNTAQRLFLWNIEAFARNDSTSPGNVKVIQAENGWVRCYGCSFQAEIPNVGQTEAVYGRRGEVPTPVSGNGGRIELYGCRTMGIAGGAFGNDEAGLFFLSDTDNNVQLDKRQGRHIVCDTSFAGFSVRLSREPELVIGSILTFINTGQNEVLLNAGLQRGIWSMGNYGQTLVVPPHSTRNLLRSAPTTGRPFELSIPGGGSLDTGSSGEGCATAALPPAVVP